MMEMERIKSWMAKPYTKGDYYGALAVVLAIYAVLGAVYIGYVKVKGWTKKRKKTEDDDLCPYIDSEEDEA